MLIITALIAWSVANVASATSVKVIRSGHKSTTWDVTSIPMSSSSVTRMDLSDRTYNSEERVELPAEIAPILSNVRVQPVSEAESFRNAQDAITEMSSQTVDSIIYEATYAIHRIRAVESHFWKSSDIPNKMISDMLENVFKLKGAFSVLVEAAKEIPIAYELLSRRVENLLKDGKDPKEVLKFLQLDTTETNPIVRKLFPMWVKFVESKYPKDAYEHMITILTDLYKGNDLKLVNALEDGMKHDPSEIVAKKLLEFQVKKWVKNERNDAELFESLLLQQPNDNIFESPAFRQWNRFLIAKLELSRTVYRQMYDILMETYQGNNLESLMIRNGRLKKKSVGNGLLKIHVKKWNLAKFSAKDVFDILDLGMINNKVINPFDNSLFNSWVYFVKRRYMYKKIDPYEMIYDTLLSHFSNEKALVGAIFYAKNKTIAKKWLTYQFNKWKNSRTTAKAVYDNLGLKESMDNPFADPVSPAWVKYVRFLYSYEDEVDSAILKVVGNNHRVQLYKLVEKRASKKRKRTGF